MIKRDCLHVTSEPTIVVEFRPDGAGFDSEIRQGPGRLSVREDLIAGLYLAYGLERNAATDTQWREALRVWLVVFMNWMRAERAPLELLSLPAKLNGLLAELEEGRQPARLTAVPRDGRGNPGIGDVDAIKPAAGCALVDFLVSQIPPPPPSGTIAAIENEIARKIVWSPKQFHNWRKKFNRGLKGERAKIIYETTRNEAKAKSLPAHEVVEILLTTANTMGCG